MEICQARSFEELSAFFDDFDRYQGWIYRGQANADWPLVPKIARGQLASELRSAFKASRAKVDSFLEINEKIDAQRVRFRALDTTPADVPPIEDSRDVAEIVRQFREFEDKIRRFLLKIERDALDTLKRYGPQYVEDAASLSEWEWLAIGQHHGLTTRLLDWSHNPLAACFFALSEFQDQDAAIYSLRCPRVLDIDEPITEFQGVARFPSRPLADRLLRQEAVFLITDPPFEERQWSSNEDVRLIKLVVPAESREVILRKIVSFGIDRAYLFPDLDGLAAHANWLAENPRLVSDAIPAFHGKVKDARDGLEHLLDIEGLEQIHADLTALVDRASALQD